MEDRVRINSHLRRLRIPDQGALVAAAGSIGCAARDAISAIVVGSDSTARPCSSHSGKPPRNQYTDLKPLVSATRAALSDFQHSGPLQWKITGLFLSSSWGPAHSSMAGSKATSFRLFSA